MAALVQPHFEALSSGFGHAGGFGGNLTVVDRVGPDMLHLVDAHWYQFPPMNPLWHSILGFVMVILGLVSAIGNGCVLLIFTTTKSLRTPSNLFVVNLAFSDFLMMATMSRKNILKTSKYPNILIFSCFIQQHQWLLTATMKHGTSDVRNLIFTS